jgi:transcriptional regulator with XRE-family HTH domain
MHLGPMLTAYRKDRKLSLRKFAKMVGVDINTIWRIENGQYETCKQWPTVLRWVFEK